MGLQFEILKVLFRGRNFFAPLKEPEKILDIGTGTGQWAIEMGKHAARTTKLRRAMLNDLLRQSVPSVRGKYRTSTSDSLGRKD